MLPLFVALMMVFFAWNITSTSDNAMMAADFSQTVEAAASRYSRTASLSAEVARYVLDTGNPPVNLATLAAQPGFETVRQNLPASGPQGDGPYYFLSNPIVDSSGLTYRRIVVFQTPAAQDVTAAQFTDAAHNTCGATDANATARWCGDPRGSWWVFETRSIISDRLQAERIAQQRLIDKLNQYYSTVQNSRQYFPDPGTGNGSAVTLLSQITSPPASAATCAGIWNFQGIPLGCNDLYSVWGTPRMYNYIDEDYVAIAVDSPYSDSTGVISIATQSNNRRT